MSYYNFIGIRSQGFMSFDECEFSLSDLGTVVVNGRNRFEPKADSNGSGKSALFDMIVWLLTGSTSRGASVVSNEILENGVYVEGELYVDEDLYIIRRSKNHPEYGTNITISKNGEDISGDTMTDSKNILSSEFNDLDYDTLTSIIILSQGLPGRLSSLKPSSRKSRLEELSRTEHYIEDVKYKIDETISELCDKISTINSKILACDSEINTNQFNINNNQRKIDEINEKSEGLITAEQFTQLEVELEQANSELSDYQSEYNEIRFSIQKNDSSKRELNNELDRLKMDIYNLVLQFQSFTSAKCPTCGNDITDETKLNEMRSSVNSQLIEKKSRVGEIISGISQIDDDSSALSLKLPPLQENINATKVLIDDMTKQMNDFRSYNSSTDILKEAIESSKTIISDKTKQKSELESQRDNLNDELNIANFYKNQASRKFRSFLLEGVVEYMNHKSKQYSPYLFEKQGVVNLRINKNNIDIYLGDRKFENLSGGEGRRVDIILQIIQRDLAKNESGLSSNVLVLDEILDYLDSIGIESVLKLFEYKSPDINSLLIVTHKKDVKVPADTAYTVIKGSDQISNLVISGA